MSEVLTYDPNIPMLDLGDERMVQKDVEAYGTSEGVTKEWDSRGRGKKLKPRDLPEADPPPPDKGQFAAIRTDDGAIYWKEQTAGSTHYSLARSKGIPPERIVGGGWITDGVYNESDRSDSSRLGERARANVRIGKYMDLNAEALWHGIPIEGFNSHGEEMIRSAISRVPPELLENVHCVKAAPQLQPKHGEYEPKTHTVNINPLIFNLMQRFGKGQGWLYHTELCLVHEIGHSIYYFLPEKKKDEWRDISGWMIGTQEGQDPPYKETRPGWPHTTSKWTHKPGIGFTRKYAQKNDDEDFADSFAFYILSKPFQMESAKREFIDKLIKERVKKYPTVAVDGPVKAYGTSEGVTKAWDSRGRGRHPKPTYVEQHSPKMDQPSKEPGYVGPKETFYHGTISDAVKKILDNGLRQAPDYQFKIKMYEDSLPLRMPKGYIYMTKSKETAMWYAQLKAKYESTPPGESISVPDPHGVCCLDFWKPEDARVSTAGEKPSVLTMDIPMSKLQGLERDPQSPDPAWEAFRLKGVVPKEYLSNIEQFDGQKWRSIWNPTTKMVAAEKTVQMFLVHYGKTTELAKTISKS